VAAHNLYVDKDRQEAVIGKDDSSPAKLPPFYQGDSFSLRIWVLEHFSKTAPYDYVPVAGVTVYAALGVKAGESKELYTWQYTWDASVDLEQPYFEAVFPMTTDEIGELLGDAASAEAWFEVKMVQDGLPSTILSKKVTVHASVIDLDEETGDVAPGLTPLSAEAANVSYLTREIYDSFDLINRATGKRRRLYVDEDGVLRSDPIT